MNYKIQKEYFAISSLAVFFPLISLCAAEASSAEAVEIEEAVVVGTELLSKQISVFKTGTPLIDIPQSVSVVTKDEIDARGIRDLADLAAYTPGLVASAGEGHRDAIVYRGRRSTADFFLDGVRDDVTYIRSFYNIEQVEILKGPNALFFGRGGTGGVINRVTKKASFDDSFNTVNFSVDTFGAYLAEMDNNIAVNDNFAFRLNTHYDYLKNHRDFYDGERIGVSPTFTYQLTENTTIRGTYEHLDYERVVDNGVPAGADGEPVEEFKDIFFGDSDENFHEFDADTIRLNLEHKFDDDWKANISAFYGDYTKLYQRMFIPSRGYDEVNAPDEVRLRGYVDDLDRENIVLSADLIGKFETGRIGHKVVFGTEYIRTSSDQDRFISNWNTTGGPVETFNISSQPIRDNVGVNSDGNIAINNYNTQQADETETTVEVQSLYVHDEIALLEKLDLVLGARFDVINVKVVDVAGSAGTRDRRDEEVSPRAGLVYKPMENVSLYASYSQTFLPRSGEQYENLGGDRDDLEPIESTNYEIGAKWEMNDRFSLSAAVFQLQEKAPEEDSLGDFFDVESDTLGFELQIDGQLTDWWNFSAGYAYLDGEQVDDDGVVRDSDGNELSPREQPEHTFSLWNSFKATEKLGFGLGVIYQDESFATASNIAVLPSYVRVDAAAYYRWSDTLSFQLNIENLLDETYFPSSHSRNDLTVGAPINATFSVTATF